MKEYKMSEMLKQVRREYESMVTSELAERCKEVGMDPASWSRAAMIDALMAVEEYACFH